MNTTFTTQNSSLLGKLSRALLKSILFFAAILCAMTVNAKNVKTPRIYYDNSTTSYDNVSFVVGHSSYSRCYRLSKISNTDLWYRYLSETGNDNWTDATEIAVFGVNWDTSEGNSIAHRRQYTGSGTDKPDTWKYTNTLTLASDLESGKVYLVTAEGNKSTTSIALQSGGYTDLNYTQTVQQHLSTDGGTNYSASTAALATVKVSSNKLNGNSSTTSSSGTIASGSSSATCSAARTATVTYTVTDVKSGYMFVGWYDGTTQKSTSTTYTYNATEAKTITARFEQEVAEPSISISTTQQYLQIGEDKLTLTINYTNIPEGHCYRVKVGDGYYNGNAKGENNDHVSISGNGSVAFTTYSTLPGGTQSIVAELWKSNPFGATSTKSNAINVTVEQGYQVSIYTRIGSTDTPAGTISPTEHIGKTITATEMPGYTFTGWTANTDNITFEDKSAHSTLVYAKSGGNIYANFTKETCVYFINTSNWGEVAVYAWNNDNDKNANWPGVTMTKTGEKIDGYDVYKYCDPYEKIIFNNNNKNNGQQTGDLVWVDGKYYCTFGVHGNFFANNEWKTTNFSSVSNDGTSASLTLNINAGSYEFGMKVPNWTSNGSSFSRADNSKAITSGNGNCNFTADITGEYTFTWTFATNTLTITYPTLSSYTVIFNKNANDATGTMANQSFNYDEAQALSPNGFTRNGYAFIGWSTASNGDVEYADEATVTNLDAANIGTVTLYAQWLSQTPTYTINFEKQNGTNGTSSATVQYQNNNYSVNPVVAPTRTDYTFGGYYTEMEGAGVQVVSAAGEWLKSVTGYTDASGNWIKNSSVTTLYAKWISNSTSTEGLPTDVYLVGSFGRWDLNDDKQQFKKATADATIYTLTWTFDAAKTYEFKVSVAGQFRGLDNNNEITVEKTSLTIPSTGNNCKITTTEAGEYIFTWDSETNTLSVEYPSDKVSLTFFGDGGTVGAVADDRVLTSPAKVKPGTSVTFTATPDANNAFSQWKMNGAVVSTDLTYTCTIDADATIEAVFLKPTTVFLKPHDEWKFNDARFAIYYWNNNGNGWVDLEQLTCDDEYYTADVPVGYSDIKFVRLNPANKDHNFNDGTCWNQTADLTLPTNGNNLYDLTKIYLKPNAEWKRDGARFAAYFFHSDFAEDKAWMSMLPTNETGVYYCDVPTDKLYNKVSFVRMKGEPSTNDWGNRLNQSKDIDLYNGSNFYTLQENKWGKNDKGESDDGMDVIYSGKWTKLELPTITITNTTPDFGDVVVKTTGGRIITNGEKVPFDTKVIVTVTPKNGYKLKTATINGASLNVGTPYTICSNTTINVTFAIKEEWYVIGVDGDWETPQERFRFVDGQLEVELDTNITANFKIAYMQGTEILNRYGNEVFNISNKSQTLNEANSNNVGNCTIATTYYGKYIFAWDAEQKKLTITYPLSVGDYRLAYQDSEDGSFHPERVIKKCIIGDRLDTVSFFVRHNKQPKLVLQHCETLTNGVGTWKTIKSNITFTVGKTGVWNFVLQQTNNPTHSVQVLTGEDDIKPYEGDYYIRTKSAKDGWTYFRSDSHKMTYSSYADNNEPFSHYFCKWVSTEAEAANKTKNVRYTIANDYGDCISDTLAADPEDANPRIVTNANGDLPTEGANVRFGWDWETNEIRRAYIAGSTNETENTFLRLDNAKELQNSNKEIITGIKFEDLQNWIYQVDVYASKYTKIDLTALYNGQVQYFKGGSEDGDERQLIVSTNDKYYKIRIIYDFKTNHLISAWLPGNETITTDEDLTADMMIIRRDQEQAEQLSFNPNTTQLNLKGTAYAVMTFTKAFIQNETYKERQRSLYWVSFPFDVKISDVFGFGEYGEHWILQYYDGEERAKKGLFIDSGTYWKYITNTKDTLKAGVGYVLALDLNKVQFLHGVEDVSLYFPSTGKIGIIKGYGETTTMVVPEHQCTITHGQMDRTIYDSHWNLIGIPGFTDPGMIDVTNYNDQIPEVFLKEDANLGFHYEFDLATNTYNVKRSTVAFKTMYSYLVQYNGTMEWNISAIDNTPAQIAARRNSNSNVPEKVSLRLEIAQNEQMIDQTFVQLQQEKATAEFDMNLDLTKIINSGANIYTLAGTNRIQTAGNTLPMENATVPVGVVISKAGEYTFRMPDGTDGIMAELIDYETNTTTNLLYDEYTVNLTKGTFENRFALFVRPNNTATSLENINGESTTNGKDVRKVLIDNILYIIRDGQMFDARGARVQ